MIERKDVFTLSWVENFFLTTEKCKILSSDLKWVTTSDDTFFSPQFLTFPHKNIFSQTPLFFFFHLSKYCPDETPNLS